MSQKPKAPAAPKPPSELDVVKADVARLSQKLDALLMFTLPVTFEGRALARCHCRKLATRIVTASHVRMGQHSEHLCDACAPQGAIATLMELEPKPVVTTALEQTQALEFIRRVNSLLTL